MVTSVGGRRVLVGVVCVAVLLVHRQVNAQQAIPPRLDAGRLAGAITLNGDLNEPS